MNLQKFFRNNEVKKISLYTFVVFCIGIMVIICANKFICIRMSKRIIDKNITIIANFIENNDNSKKYIRNLTETPSEEEINKAAEILKEHGYDNDISIDLDKSITEMKRDINIVFICFFVVFIVIIFFGYLLLLRKMYKKMDESVNKVSEMSNGTFVKITPDYEEGEISRLIDSLNYMGERVNNSIVLLNKEKSNLKDFLSDISHQLKTPLAALIMFNDILRENENMPHEDMIDFLNKCNEQLDRMQWLIMNLLKVGRLEAGVINFEMKNQEISSAINLSISSLKELASKKNQIINISGDLKSQVYHDCDWIAEALSNIIKNAIEHTQEGGYVNVDVKRGPLITKIYIKDNGEGMTLDMQKNIFKRFYKGENSVNPKSIGIGLSISKSIIEKHKGDIKLNSVLNGGTTFIISLYNEKID